MADVQLVTCNACGAVYRPVQADGTLYFHACPPRRVIGSEPAPTKDDPKATRQLFASIDNPRDENVHVVDDKGTVAMKRAGAGVTPVHDPAAVAAFLTPQEAV